MNGTLPICRHGFRPLRGYINGTMCGQVLLCQSNSEVLKGDTLWMLPRSI
jgi:hypothetical protein